MKLKLILSGLLMSLWWQTRAQDPVQLYDFVSIKEGISKVGIYTIVQDDLGFIWLGTNGAGLYRYDGISYTNFKYHIKDSSSLSSSRVLSSYLDSENRLWFGTEDGLNLYDRENDRFKRIDNAAIESPEGGMTISSIIESPDGHLLVGTLNQGLFKLKLPEFWFEKIISKEVLDSQTLNINALAYDINGKLYAATDRGIKEYDPKTKTLKPFNLTEENGAELQNIEMPIESLIIDDFNQMWAGSRSNGLLKITLVSDDAISRNPSVEHLKMTTNQILSLLDLKDGTIMCGTENDGLYHLDDSGRILNNYASNEDSEHKIHSNSIWSMFLDNQDRIWLGYYNKGVSVYDRLYDKFKELEQIDQNSNSLNHGSVTAMVQDQKERLWIATDGGGIDIYDEPSNKILHINKDNQVHYKGLSNNYIEALFRDSQNNLWAGSWEGGLFLLKNGSKTFKNFTVETTDGALSSNTILSMDEDKEGVIWMGSFNGGLNSYNLNTKQFKHYDEGPFVDNRFTDVEIRKVLVDQNDAIWLGSSSGLFKLETQDDGERSLVNMQERMPADFLLHNSSNNILSLFETDDGTLWIGTRGAGLCKYDPKTDQFSWYGEHNGLMEENVNGIAEGLDGSIWLAGNTGITKLDRTIDAFTNYSSNDGLVSDDYNINSTFRDAEGRLYFGSFKGVDYFNPLDINVNQHAPDLYLTEFKLFNENVVPNGKKSPLSKVISRTDSLTLNSDQSVFTIEYSSINFTRPEKNEYAYYLEGYENDWNYVGKKRSATYTNLDAGDYVFRLKAANNDGVWSEKPLDLHISILPPWWKTAWAILAYILLFLGGLYLLNVLTKNRLRDKQMVENERNNRLLEKELNEKKLQFFTNISHEFRTPLSLIISPLEDLMKNDHDQLPERVKQKHYTIHKNTNRLFRLINELIDFRKLDLGKIKIKVRKMELVSFAKGVASHFKEEAFSKNIHFSIDADLHKIPFWADESMLEKIIFNILSNAFKVTPEGGAISMELSLIEDGVKLPLADDSKKIKGVEIKISDTGPGLSKDQVNRIFKRFYQVDNLNKIYYGGTGIGLEVVKNFVKLHKGKIKVKSEVGSGTTFKVILPANKKYFNADEFFNENIAETDTKEKYVMSSSMDNEQSQKEETLNTNLKTLLIVEDNTELRNYLKSELKSQYKILLAKNGKEGLDIAKANLPDIILTDVIMPEMDGFVFCKHIKSDVKTSHIPLLMLTAKTTIENRVEGIENGADAYMVKPFDMGLLKLRLSQLITSRQLIFNKYFNVLSDANTNNTTSIDKAFIEKVLKYINEGIGDPNLNVETLASKLNLSRSQFYRKIKALTNQTANEFIRNIRLLRAKQIIEAGNNNISEVCYKVGFSSPSYFTKCFKAHFGILPKEVEPKDKSSV